MSPFLGRTLFRGLRALEAQLVGVTKLELFGGTCTALAFTAATWSSALAISPWEREFVEEYPELVPEK